MTGRKLAVFFLLSVSWSSAWAHELPAYLAASREFLTNRFRLESKNTLPRLTDAEWAPMLAILSDSERFFGRGNFKVEEIKDLKGLCIESGKVTMSYMAFNLNKQIADPVPEIATSKDKLRAVMDMNNRLFQSELALVYPFSVKCSAEEARLTADILRSLSPAEITERQRSDLRAFRTTILNSYVYLLPDVIDENLTVSYRAALFKAFAATAGTFKSVLRPDERTQVIDVMARLRPSVPSQMLESLATVESEMAATECIDLCAVK